MTGRIEKTVFISRHYKSSSSTMQPNFSSPQKRIRPHALSRMGEGQTDTPINHLNQGEGGIISLNHATQLLITPEKDSTSYPLPAGEGQTDTPINHHNQGEVP